MTDGENIEERLFAKRIPEDDFEIEGVGTIRVRAISRHLLLGMGDEAGRKSPLVAERRMIAAGMVHPAMTEEQAGRWQRAAPAGEIQRVLAKIRDLSGLSEGADKSGLQGVSGES